MVVGQCALMSEIASALFETWLETGCKFAKSAFGPSRHIAPPHELSRYRGEADIAFRCITPLGLWVHGLGMTKRRAIGLSGRGSNGELWSSKGEFSLFFNGD